MDIATKAARIRSGEDSQHSTYVARRSAKPLHTRLLRALLRRSAESAGRAPARAPITSTDITSALVADTDGAETPAVPGEAVSYEVLSFIQLKEEIRARNEMRGEGETLGLGGSRLDLIERLIDDDARQYAQ